MSTSRRDFLLATGGLILASQTMSWAQSMGKAAGGPLNLLLITADDMNATMPGWMGRLPVRLTPNMDAFAATCHRFVNNRASAPICQPSRESLMTGLVPHRSGGYGFNPVRPDTPSIATILKSQGYYLAAINKITHMEPPEVFPWDKRHEPSGKNPDAIAADMQTALNNAKTEGKPFFINCNITDPHRPFYGDGHRGPARQRNDPEGILAHEITPDQVAVPSFLEDLPDIRTEVAQYFNSVQRLDLSFGKAIDALRASGQYDRTVILFVSDHGMPFPFSKATVFNNGLWCPVILRYPGMDKPRQFTEYTSSIDIMPTMLELLGAPVPKDIDGRSWVPLFAGRQQPDRDFIIGHVNTLSSNVYYPQRVVQTAEFALCFAPWSDGKRRFQCESMSGLTMRALNTAAKNDLRIADRVEQYLRGIPLAFYDLKLDPDQRKNVIDDPQYKQQVDRLKGILHDHMERTKDPEFENYKLVLAGKPANIEPSTERVKQEIRELRKAAHQSDETSE